MATYITYPTEEQGKTLIAFLEASKILFVKDDFDEELPRHVLEGIAQGQADIKAGRFFTFEEFKKNHLISAQDSTKRQGWESAFQDIAKNGDDELLFPDVFDDEDIKD